jgi:hypothetical protein
MASPQVELRRLQQRGFQHLGNKKECAKIFKGFEQTG